MKTNQLWGYLAPEVEVLQIEVEQGFEVSNMESIGDEKPEQEW